MKLKSTLILISIQLIFNTVYAENLSANECNKLLTNGDSSGALRYANKMLSKNSADREAMLCQGRAYYANGDYQAAVKAFELAEKNTKDGLDIAVAMFMQANAYKGMQQKDMALANYQRALKQAQSIGNSGLQRLAYKAIGDIAIDDQQFSAALDWYLLAFKLAANDNERGESAENVALAYHELNQHGLALEFQIKAYLLHGRVGTLDQYANSSIVLGSYYAADKNYGAAEKTLTKIITFAKEQGGIYYEAKATYVLALVKVAAGDKKAAQDLLVQALSLAKSANDKALELEIAAQAQGLI